MYKQNKHPFPVTSCGRRRSEMQTGANTIVDGPLSRVRKTTKGKGRNFRSTEEGAGMTVDRC